MSNPEYKEMSSQQLMQVIGKPILKEFYAFMGEAVGSDNTMEYLEVIRDVVNELLIENTPLTEVIDNGEREIPSTGDVGSDGNSAGN